MVWLLNCNGEHSYHWRQRDRANSNSFDLGPERDELVGAQHQPFDVRDCYKVRHGHCDWIFNYRHSGPFGVVAEYELPYPAYNDPAERKLFFHERALHGLEFHQLVFNVGDFHGLSDTDSKSHKHDHINAVVNFIGAVDFIGVINFIGVTNSKQLAINQQLILEEDVHSVLDTDNKPSKHDHIIGIANFKQLAVN